MATLPRFTITTQPIEPDLGALISESAGGLVYFEGRVRDLNEGQAVLSLEYELYETLAFTEGNQIIEEAYQQFDILEARCTHRFGHLQLKDIAVWVGVAARHRAEAFQACSYIIDQIKHRLPIWKKEHYLSGDAQWVSCQHPHNPTVRPKLSLTHADYYQMQLLLPAVGNIGQHALGQARVLIVGAGGLGSSVLLYLAGAGIGQLGICDPDWVSVSNLHRQILFNTDDLGHPKASCAANKLGKLNPWVTVKPYTDELNSVNASDRIKDYDLVIDCTDQPAAKLLINDTCTGLSIPFITASVYQYEGQLRFWRPTEHASCLRCHTEEITNNLALLGGCPSHGVLGVTPGLFGILQATQALGFFLNHPDQMDSNALHIVDIWGKTTHTITIPTDPQCTACQIKTGLVAQKPNNPNLTAQIPISASFIFQPHELEAEDFSLIDIRPFQMDLAPAPPYFETYQWFRMVAHEVSVNTIPDYDPARRYVLVCQEGVQSLAWVKKLRPQVPNLYSLWGGINTLLKQV